MSYLEVSNLNKGFGAADAREEVLSDINLSVAEGEFIAIVGFSGSGKTTLISALAGLIEPDSGTITINGDPIDGPGFDRGLVFQSYSLMPWLTVHGNIALAVDAVYPDWSTEQRSDHVRKYISMVGLDHAADRKPAELSGGMRQRVSVARALAMNPDILLLDEPLGALDALTRANLQDEIEQIWRKDKRTVILITNDVDEAVLLADRVIPLKPGPNATLGPEFNVDLARPRDRASISKDPDFIALRRSITGYLIDVSTTGAANTEHDFILPDISPITQNSGGTIISDDRFVEFSKASKIYPTPNGPLTVLDGFHLKIAKGEFVSLIGHSGCGKSTALTMAAGLNEISSGAIILDGKQITDAGPDRGVVFQAPNLFPWLTAGENVMLGVNEVYPDASQSERDDIAAHYLARVGLGDAIDRKVAGFSNGMKQRVGIARAFALSPKLLLLDEPFGMLDTLTRWELQEVLMDVWRRNRMTAICVTHDVDEAILLADRVVMMTNGPNAKVGKVMEVNLPHPRSRKEMLNHPDYYQYREEVLSFLADCDHPAPKEVAAKAAE